MNDLSFECASTTAYFLHTFFSHWSYISLFGNQKWRCNIWTVKKLHHTLLHFFKNNHLKIPFCYLRINIWILSSWFHQTNSGHQFSLLWFNINIFELVSNDAKWDLILSHVVKLTNVILLAALIFFPLNLDFSFLPSSFSIFRFYQNTQIESAWSSYPLKS